MARAVVSSKHAPELGPQYFDPFSPAEAAAQDAIIAILTKGGKMLYDSWLEKRSKPFAAEVITKQLTAELLLCYVRFDRGEQRPAGLASEALPAEEADVTEGGARSSGWELEPEPPRCRIDTWARAVVPMKKKVVVKPRVEEVSPKRRGRSGSVSAASSRAPSRLAAAATSTPFHGSSNLPPGMVGEPIPIVEPRHEDEEEVLIREKKEREERRIKEEHDRVKKKAAAAKAEAVKAEQARESINNDKPYTHDSNGAIIWIQPPIVQSLPDTSPPMKFNFHREKLELEMTGAPKKTPRKSMAVSKQKQHVHADSFKKDVSRQPSAFEHMVLSPGVELSNRKGKKKSQPLRRDRGQPMSRNEYEDMVRVSEASFKGEGQPSTTDSPRVAESADSRSDQDALGSRQVSGLLATAPSSARAASRSGSAEAVGAPTPRRSENVGLVAKPPETPRPMQPAAPPSVRRLKNGALQAASLRERMNPGTSSRFPNCGPQPVLGATMGHGLVKSGSNDEEFYFPPEGRKVPTLGLALGSIMSDDASAVGEAPLVTVRSGASKLTPLGSPRTPRTPGGSIVSRKPDFLQRYFPPSSPE